MFLVRFLFATRYLMPMNGRLLMFWRMRTECCNVELQAASLGLDHRKASTVKGQYAANTSRMYLRIFSFFKVAH